MQINTSEGERPAWKDAVFLTVGKVAVSFIVADSPYGGDASTRKPYTYLHGLWMEVLGVDWAYLSGRLAACNKMDGAYGLFVNLVQGNLVDFTTVPMKSAPATPAASSSTGSYMPKLAAPSTSAIGKDKADGFRLPYTQRGKSTPSSRAFLNSDQSFSSYLRLEGYEKQEVSTDSP